MTSFTIGMVTVEILDGARAITAVPPSQWHGDRKERVADATLANLQAADGLRARIALVKWPDDDEVSLGHAEIFGGPADYERLEDAGLISPKAVGDKLVARIRALKYGEAGRASGAVTDWAQIGGWADADAPTVLRDLGATATGTYGDLLPSATRFKSEPAIEVLAADPRALFAVYALTRVMPIMTGHGKSAVEGPNA
ncbi:hypothetical protein BKA04_001525 [Cryobacterium mesophilum]|uniref:Uncharacterized protein n=2 Tax=Terrimesophilobacter mesophilus TaxID=433647 RepID=A0A4R8VA03_9MICO|nr:hypothetical protein [Terrimesophilobacter mesophilus]MBB5633302.1 hypothetical protein [Terrimesophilobacter mesophilus]TFB80041.1 hypothetical protein E3N84_08280 [Terrimesophilobacter mesophilus]